MSGSAAAATNDDEKPLGWQQTHAKSAFRRRTHHQANPHSHDSNTAFHFPKPQPINLSDDEDDCVESGDYVDRSSSDELNSSKRDERDSEDQRARKRARYLDPSYVFQELIDLEKELEREDKSDEVVKSNKSKELVDVSNESSVDDTNRAKLTAVLEKMVGLRDQIQESSASCDELYDRIWHEAVENRISVSSPEHQSLRVKMVLPGKSSDPVYVTVFADQTFSEIRDQLSHEIIGFVFDGERVDLKQSPQDVGMENEDQLDVVVQSCQQK